MKLKMIYLLSLLVCAGLVVRAQTGHRSRTIAADALSPKVAENILKRDKMVLEKNLRSEVLTDENWAKVNDFTLSVKELVKFNTNPRALFKLSGQSINDLSSCLKKNFCGMERKDDKDAYFDEANTPGHILLGRNLEIMIEVLNREPELSKDIDWDLIRELTESSNEKVQVLAVNLLRRFNSKEGTSEAILKIADNYKGNAKANALVEIAGDISEEAHNQLLSMLSKTFASDDPNTAISVMEKLPLMHLTPREMEMVANYLCHYKQESGEEHNWKMIKYRMGKIQVDMDTVCP